MSTILTNRRGLIKSGAGIGAGLSLPMVFTASPAAAYTNEPKGSTVTIGINVPQSGPYSDEGADELRGYQLAIEHLNGEGDGGMINTFSSKSLKRNGILGKKVVYVTGDTQTKPAPALAAARSMIKNDGAVMVTGGSSSGVAIAVQKLCQEEGVVFMSALTNSNDTTGKDKTANGFRYFFNAYMTAAALAPVLNNRYGGDRKTYYLTADYTWGWSVQESMASATEAMGWQTRTNVLTPLSTKDFKPYVEQVLQSDADVLVLNHYGSNLVNSLNAVKELDLRNRTVNGKKLEIVVPLMSRLVAKNIGENLKGILSTMNWHWTLQDDGSKAFVQSFGEKYGFPPSQAAHTAYAQMILYADACERSNSFNPCGVISALEGFIFDGLGNGPSEYRAEDHQCFKDVLIVKGNDSPTSEFDLLEILEVTPRAKVEYAVDNILFAGGNMGQCNPGL